MSDEFKNKFIRTNEWMGKTHSYFSSDDFEKYLKNTYASSKGRYILFKYTAYYPSGGMEDSFLRTDEIENVVHDIRLVFDEFVGNYDTLNYFDIDTNKLEDIRKEQNE